MTEQPTRIRTKAEEALANHFASLAGDDPMRDIRATAFDAFMAQGLPHRRIEDWKYTDLRALMQDVPAPAEPAPAEAAREALKTRRRLRRTRPCADRLRQRPLRARRSPTWRGSADAVDFASLGRFLADGGAILDRSLDPAEAPIYALNSAFVRDGAVLKIRDSAKLARPLEIVNLYAGTSRRPADAAPSDRDRRGREGDDPAELHRPRRRRLPDQRRHRASDRRRRRHSAG